MREKREKRERGEKARDERERDRALEWMGGVMNG